ncbi:hypothetical protein [Microcystis phage Mel-JY01]
MNKFYIVGTRHTDGIGITFSSNPTFQSKNVEQVNIFGARNISVGLIGNSNANAQDLSTVFKTLRATPFKKTPKVLNNIIPFIYYAIYKNTRNYEFGFYQWQLPQASIDIREIKIYPQLYLKLSGELIIQIYFTACKKWVESRPPKSSLDGGAWRTVEEMSVHGTRLIEASIPTPHDEEYYSFMKFCMQHLREK